MQQRFKIQRPRSAGSLSKVIAYLIELPLDPQGFQYSAMSSSVHSPTVTVMAAASTTTTAAKKAPKLYYAMSHDAWFLIAAIIAALALLRLAAFVRRRRRQHRGRSSSSSSASSSVSTTNLLSFPRSLLASLQNVLFLTSFPPTSTDGQRSRWLSRAWPYSMPIHELLWSIAYFAAVMVFGFYGCECRKRPAQALLLFRDTLC